MSSCDYINEGTVSKIKIRIANHHRIKNNLKNKRPHQEQCISISVPSNSGNLAFFSTPFYQKLHNLLNTAKRGGHGDSSRRHEFRCRSAVLDRGAFRRSFWSRSQSFRKQGTTVGHRLILASINFGRSNYRDAICGLLSSSRNRIQTEHIVICYEWQGY